MFLQAKTLPDGSAHTHGIYKGVPPGVLNKAQTVPFIRAFIRKQLVCVFLSLASAFRFRAV